MRPCDENKKCKYEDYDYGENCVICTIDFSGDNCPYTKPGGKQKYKRDHERKE